MDFDQIRAFINVASLKSFSGAAEKMFISQPSVSIKIKALEEELGVLLFDRSKAREPILTEAGRIFLDFAQLMHNLEKECREKLSGKREDDSGLVYIGASTVPGTCILPVLLAKFKITSPAVYFNLSILDTSAVLEGILDYSYDFGLVGLTRPDERLKYIPLLEDELVLCTARGLLEDNKDQNSVGPEILFSMPLVLREKGSATRQLLEMRLAEASIELADITRFTYINSLEGIRQAVREGLGVAVCSRLSVNDMVEAGTVDVYKIEGIDLRRSLYLAYHRSRVLGGAAERVKNFIVREFT